KEGCHFMLIALFIPVLLICFPILPVNFGPTKTPRKLIHGEGSFRPDSNVRPPLPPNISAPGSLHPLLTQMLMRSPTFRKQIDEIGDSANTRVTLLLVAPNVPRTYRAISRIEKDRDKNVRITIELTACTSYFELLGHEFEHAAEQVEGINLKLLSTRK